MKFKLARLGQKSFLRKFIIPKLKFAATSGVATGVDVLLYLFLVHNFFTPKTSTIISQGTGMIINFILQKKFVFIIQRKLSVSFIMSILFSLFAVLFLGKWIIGYLVQYPFFERNQLITKMIATGIVFIYNFYTKRFAFEKKGLGESIKEDKKQDK